MIDKEKVTVMTKEAMAERRDRRKIFPAAGFYMYDYVCFQVLKGILGVTLFYVLAVGCWLLLTMDSWISTISLPEILSRGIFYGKIYILVAAGAALILIAVYTVRWIRSQEVLRQHYSNLKKLNRFYDQEDDEWSE